MDVRTSQPDDLFAWTDDRVVLFVDHNDDSWVVARGWRGNDRLTDIRRWTFDSEIRAMGQIRRLVVEATGDPVAADGIATQLNEWLATRTPLV